MNRTRQSHSAVKADVSSMLVGRTPLGVWYAHLCEGSTIVQTRRAVSRRRVIALGQRDALVRYGQGIVVAETRGRVSI